jgi:hypothetical protein
MLIVPPVYGFTIDEIVQVAVARATEWHVAFFLCASCGRTKFTVSRDTGMSPKWLPTAQVIDRLAQGHLIEGKMDP